MSFVLALAITLSSHHSACAPRHGEAYIICKETGNNPARYAHGEPHHHGSSASGLYGMLASTRRTYGTAYNYMLQRYGSWEAAEAFHRRHNYW